MAKKPAPHPPLRRNDVDYHTYIEARDRGGKSDAAIAAELNSSTKLRNVKASDVAAARSKWKIERDYVTLLESWVSIEREVVSDALDTGDKQQLAAALREAANQIEA